MLIISNLLIITIFLCLVSVIINKYNEIVFDKFKYRYFALRDRLSMLVVKGDLKESDWEYKELVDVINFHIYTTESMSIGKVAIALSKYHSSPKEEQRVRRINKSPHNEEVFQIFVDFILITHQLLVRNSSMQIRFLRFLEKLSLKNKSIAMPVAKNRFVAINKIKGHLALLQD